MTIINVKAAPGLRVPREDNGRKYITDDKETPVEQTAYYLRRLADGDLVEVNPTPAGEQAPPADAPATRAAKKGA